ncbi:alanine racemase [Phaeodactylibacter luteus]|uniref:Alanine racemase n=1 Tax=Phaeodactylibacter luteus TaxID=1564516 RepID=A0A5C6RQI1_9BACT|nr:alanine racemase [Phaeodactylibacter luteus]TXB64427.1 alanine racemase [Phaeodactylibacter luteus]
MMDFSWIETPTLLLDERICRRNIQRMAEKARKERIRLRPHFKTPQSLQVGQWFRDAGVHCATVSSLQMARYFADGGWSCLTVAFPVNLREIRSINELASRIRLGLTLEDAAVARRLGELLLHPVDIWVKIDIGNHRTGLRPNDTAAIRETVKAAEQHPLLQLKGFLSHAGQSYQARSQQEIAHVHEQSLSVVQALKQAFPGLQYSLGDTPTASVMSQFPSVDELRPGNFAFYDLMQWQTGACTIADIALALACPIVARHPERREVVLYGGAVHLSKDRLLLPDGSSYFGLPARRLEGKWELFPKGSYLSRLSQEHGILSCTPELFAELEIGSLVHILPVHSCLTANLMKGYRGLGGEYLDMMPATYPEAR